MRLGTLLVLVLVLALAAAPTARAQADADHATPEAVVGALYAAITGPAGLPRDWARFRALFVAEGRLTRVGRTPAGAPLRRSFTVDEFVAQTDSAMRAGGYDERELRRTVTRFGAMAHVLSTYAARDLSGAQPARRGLNSVQLYEDATGWHIQSLLWDVERAGVSWPADAAPPDAKRPD